MNAIAGGPTVRFADEAVTEPVKYVVNMNEWMKGYVVEGLSESLVSEVLFTSERKMIHSNDGHDDIKVRLVNDEYYIDLNDIDHIPTARKLMSKTLPVSAYVARMNVGEKIKDLHERMGHAHSLIMAQAVKGKMQHGKTLE